MRSDIISFVLLISVISIIVGFLISSGMFVQKKIQIGQYIEQDMINYNKFLYYVFVYTPYLVRSGFFRYIVNYFYNMNPQDIQINPIGISNFCNSFDLYNISESSNGESIIVEYKPCIALFSLYNISNTNPNILNYIENYVSGYENSYVNGITIDNSNYLLNVSFYYDNCNSNYFCRYFSLNNSYSIIPDIILYDYAITPVYNSTSIYNISSNILYEMFYVNNTDFKYNLSLYQEVLENISNYNTDQYGNVYINYNVSIPLLFYIYDSSLSEQNFNFELPIQCLELGGEINDGVCTIPYINGEPAAYFCLNESPKENIKVIGIIGNISGNLVSGNIELSGNEISISNGEIDSGGVTLQDVSISGIFIGNISPINNNYTNETISGQILDGTIEATLSGDISGTINYGEFNDGYIYGNVTNNSNILSPINVYINGSITSYDVSNIAFSSPLNVNEEKYLDKYYFYVINNISYCDEYLSDQGQCNINSYPNSNLLSNYPEIPDNLNMNSGINQIENTINNIENEYSQYNIYVNSNNYYPILVPSIISIDQTEYECRVGYILENFTVDTFIIMENKSIIKTSPIQQLNPGIEYIGIYDPYFI